MENSVHCQYYKCKENSVFFTNDCIIYNFFQLFEPRGPGGSGASKRKILVFLFSICFHFSTIFVLMDPKIKCIFGFVSKFPFIWLGDWSRVSGISSQRARGPPYHIITVIFILYMGDIFCLKYNSAQLL